jgi:hypothetical protein
MMKRVIKGSLKEKRLQVKRMICAIEVARPALYRRR